MKKLFLLIAMIFAMNTTCFAAGSDSPVASSKIYQDSEYKISVQLPEGFDYADDEDINTVVAAEDKKGGSYKIVAIDAESDKAEAGTDKTKLRELKDSFKKEYTKSGLEIYSEYTIKINPDHFGYFMEGYVKGSGDSGKIKLAVIKFYHNNKLFTVTLKAPYEQKGYLRSFKRFRTSITCKN